MQIIQSTGNSIEADVWMDLAKYYDNAEIDTIMESDFDAYAKETEDWMENCGVTTFEKFEYLTVYHNL
jgi:hypothetical protein